MVSLAFLSVAWCRSAAAWVRYRVLSALVIAGFLAGRDRFEGGDDAFQAVLHLAEAAGQAGLLVQSAVRTAIGKCGGGLAAVPPCDLAAAVVREAVTRAGVPSVEVGHAVFGNVIHTEVRDMYLSRAAVNGGLPVQTPAFTVNRLCGSGLQAILSAAQAIRLGDCDVAVRNGCHPMGRLVAYAHAGVEPRVMGIGPVPAVRKVLERAELKLDDIDLFEVNEAFAAQALAVVKELGLPPDRTNPNGSGISLGHPIGATGAILPVKALYELRRTGGQYALVTMCIGGGQGIAAVFERI